jgi:predicted RNase H-like HicB family nuclease
MKLRSYTVIIEPDEPKGYHAWAPALPGCHTAGRTYAEAKRNIREAIDVYIESLEARGQAIPKERTRITKVELKVA